MSTPSIKPSPDGRARTPDFDTWFPSRSGLTLDLLNPTLDMIVWDDIAEALAKACRFGGHCRGFYSVAQHSLLVAQLMPRRWRAYGLLHDAHEAFTGDLISPLKALIGEPIRRIERRLDALIYQAAGIDPPTPEIAASIKRADIVALATERRDVVASSHLTPWTILEGVEPADIRIRPFESWRHGRDRWLFALRAELPDAFRKPVTRSGGAS